MNYDHVSRRWLLLLHTLYVLVDLILIAVIVLVHLHHSSHHLLTHWGLTYTALSVAGVHAIYGIAIYPFLQKRNIWIATAVSQVLFDLVVATLIQNSGFTNLAYRIGWIITVGLSAALGIYIVIGEVFVNALLNFFALIGLGSIGGYSEPIKWLLTAGLAAGGFIGWLVFRKSYRKTGESSPLDTANRNINQSQLQSNVIFQSITDGVLVYDVTGKITAMNPAAAGYLGWAAKDAVGLDIHLVMKLNNENGKPLDSSNDLFMDLLSTHERLNATYQLTGQQNKNIIISLVISPIVASASQVAGAVAVFRDITEERKEQQQRADFISTASHEMRTPVAAIEGYLSLALNDKVSSIDSKARDFLEKAHESTQHLGQLFQDLLTSAKAEDGRLSNHPEVVEMGSLVQKITEDTRFNAQKKHLGMEFLVGNNELIDARQTDKPKSVVRPLYYVLADPDRLREVITNIIDNGIKYTDTGKISVGLTGDKGVVQLYIKDTGPGIPAEDLPHLFQKFYRVDNSATRTVGGTGLGLFISRKIVELYHGRIWVESKLTQGSTFYINLPRLSPEKAAGLQAAQPKAGELTGTM